MIDDRRLMFGDWWLMTDDYGWKNRSVFISNVKPNAWDASIWTNTHVLALSRWSLQGFILMSHFSFFWGGCANFLSNAQFISWARENGHKTCGKHSLVVASLTHDRKEAQITVTWHSLTDSKWDLKWALSNRKCIQVARMVDVRLLC